MDYYWLLDRQILKLRFGVL